MISTMIDRRAERKGVKIMTFLKGTVIIKNTEDEIITERTEAGRAMKDGRMQYAEMTTRLHAVFNPNIGWISYNNKRVKFSSDDFPRYDDTAVFTFEPFDAAETYVEYDNITNLPKEA